MAESMNPLAAYIGTPSPSPAPSPARSENPLAGFVETGQSTPAPAAPDRTALDYIGETVSNIPQSAGAVASVLWSAVSSPVDTMKAIGSAGIGGVQLAKDALARISQTHLGGVSSGADEPGCGSICVALRQSGPGLIV